MKKVFLGITAIIVISIIGFFGYRYYQIRKTRNNLSPIIQNITLRILNDTNYEIESSKITYKELFDKTGKDLSEIDSKIIDLQTISSSFNENEIKASIEYAKACQELLRALSSKYHSQLAFNSAVEWVQKSKEQYDNAGEYTQEYAGKAYLDSVNESNRKVEEYKSSINDLLKAIKRVETVRLNIQNIFLKKDVIDNQILAELTKKNQEELTEVEKWKK